MTTQDTGHNYTRWQLNTTALDVYLQREGHTRVPISHIERFFHAGAYHEVPLGTWVSYVRQRYRQGLLSSPRIDELSGLPGWEWGPLRPGPDADTIRNDKMRAMRADHKSLREIGDAFSLSRQRVHQIVGNLPPAPPRPTPVPQQHPQTPVQVFDQEVHQ